MKKILWVEDDFRAVEDVAASLQRAGHEIYFLTSRVKAEKFIDDGWRGDLILLDSMMPESERHYSHSGCDLFLQLRGGRWEEWGRSVPVIFITAYAPNVTEKIQNITPAPDILAKPVPSTEALKAMRRYLQDAILTTSLAPIPGNGRSSIPSETKVRQQLPLSPEAVHALTELAARFIAAQNEKKRQAAQFLLKIIAANDRTNEQEAAIVDFERWMADNGDEIRKYLKTRAKKATATAPFLQLLAL